MVLSFAATAIQVTFAEPDPTQPGAEQGFQNPDTGSLPFVPEQEETEEPEEGDDLQTSGQPEEPEEPDDPGKPEDSEAPEEADDRGTSEETEEEEEAAEPGSISGFIWNDGNGKLGTDWDGLFNGSDEPLAGYPVYLFAAGNTRNAVAQTLSMSDGTYMFESLEPGMYIVGLANETVGGISYLLPMIVTGESVFTTNMSQFPLMAYTMAIDVQAGAAVTGIGAGMRMPMGMVAAAHNIIQLGTGAQANGNYTGYALSGTPPSRTLTFNSAANTHTYELILTNACQFNRIEFSGCSTTVTLNGITFPSGTFIELTNSSSVTLLLSGTNTLNPGYITTTVNTALTIDSAASTGANPGATSGVLNIVSNSTSRAGIGGRGSATVSNCGRITINGGTINVSRSTAVLDAIPNAASIGGSTNEIAHVTINGGNVTASNLHQVIGSNNSDGGAAIGGGHGAAARGEVYINGGTVTAITGQIDPITIYTGGAAIGGGAYNAYSTVVITGGTINAIASHGAAIGGGCNSVGNITISGYNTRITAESVNGASIGNGANARLTGPAGSVKISEATILAYNIAGSGIGAGVTPDPTGSNPASRLVLPEYEIWSSAKITVISRGQYAVNGAGILGAGQNKGDAWFVNLYFWNSVGLGLPATRVIAVDAETNRLVYDVPLAASQRQFLVFSFTTGKTVSSNYRVYANYGHGLAQFVRYDRYIGNITHNTIHSVNAMGGYRVYQYPNPTDYLDRDFLPYNVNPTDDAGIACVVTERYVNTNGADMPGMPAVSYAVAKGSSYTASPPAISGYTAAGYKLNTRPDSSGTDFSPLPYTANNIQNDFDIYIVYKVAESSVEISKKVTGSFANMTNTFTFTVYFSSSNAIGNALPSGTRFNYTGGIKEPGPGVTAPANGVLTLGSQGQASFTLRHGQMITITNVPDNVYIRFVETMDTNFITKHRVSGGAEIVSNDTGYRQVGGSGSGARVFQFINEQRVAPVPNGITDDVRGPVSLAVVAVLLTSFGGLAFTGVRRRRNY